MTTPYRTPGERGEDDPMGDEDFARTYADAAREVARATAHLADAMLELAEAKSLMSSLQKKLERRANGDRYEP